MAKVNLLQVRDTCNVPLHMWRITADSTLLHLVNPSLSDYSILTNFTFQKIQVHVQPELFLPQIDHTLMPQNCTGENMFTKMCLAVSKEARIYNREKRVSSTSGASIDQKKKKKKKKTTTKKN